MAKKAKHTGELAALTANMPQLIDELESKMAAVDAQMAELEKAGVIYATEHWRKDADGEPKYFYLLYPKKPDEARRRDYIGSDAAKIEDARAGMRRAQEFDGLAAKLATMRNQVYQATQALRDATRFLSR
ncbi:hypothetical protein [Pseudomonas sp. LB3P58]